jgi:molybdopterin molybdotransferase
VVLPAGKSKFKKGQIVDCFFPNHINQSLIW